MNSSVSDSGETSETDGEQNTLEKKGGNDNIRTQKGWWEEAKERKKV